MGLVSIEVRQDDRRRWLWQLRLTLEELIHEEVGGQPSHIFQAVAWRITMAATAPHNLTKRTRIALAIARGIAAANGHENLTSVHVALGILREGENPAVAILEQGGVQLKPLRRALDEVLPSPGRLRDGEVALPPTPGERALVEGARAEADLLGAPFTGTQHLLLAMLRDPAHPAAQIIARHGMAFESALTQLATTLGPPGIRQSTGHEEMFVRTWDAMEHRCAVSARDLPVELGEAVRALIREMRGCGYDRHLRAGMSLYSLVLSRSAEHGLRRDQPAVSVDVPPRDWDGRMRVSFDSSPGIEFVEDCFALTPALEQTLADLAWTPID